MALKDRISRLEQHRGIGTDDEGESFTLRWLRETFPDAPVELTARQRREVELQWQAIEEAARPRESSPT